jgi:hypothetical protein
MHEQDDAPDKPPTLLVTVIVIFSFLFVFGMIALSFPISEELAESKEEAVNTGMGNTERIVYISGQKQIMSSYKKIDDQYYQIPIQQAMKMVVNSQGDMLDSRLRGNDN